MQLSDNCPCDSGASFIDCCKIPMEGKTPEDLKNLIRRSVVRTFKATKYIRGESCRYSAQLVKDLLLSRGIRSYVVAGSARWDYPLAYQWKPDADEQEFHVWTVTQYGEYVDLSCDDIESREDFNRTQTYLNFGYTLTPPTWCWRKELFDREYIAFDIGSKRFGLDDQCYKDLISECQKHFK